MKITLAVLFLAALTIYCKCTAVLSLPPSLIAQAASLEESPKTQKSFTASSLASVKDNESKQQQLLQQQDNDENEELSNEAAAASIGLAADLYTNLKNLWQSNSNNNNKNNDLSLNLQKRERNTFDDDIVHVATQPGATIKLDQLNPKGLKSDNNDNEDDTNNNNHNNNNKNENNFLKSSLKELTSPSSMPLSSSAINLNIPLSNPNYGESYANANDWLSSGPQMIDDIFVSPPHQIPEPPQLKREALENMPLAAIAAPTAEDDDSAFMNRFVKPTKYWPTIEECTLENENNCLQEYYGDLIADRNNVLLKHLQLRQNHPFANKPEKSSTLNPSSRNDINDDDIVMLLTAEQNLIQFLGWALAELYPYGKFNNITDNGADSYDPGMYIWKKLNLSGHLEPPLVVEEPRYVIVRREYDESDDDETEFKRGLNYGGDPFIPPRGRKHNLPDLDSLLHRYETFVPNRGRRDKIKDIFKYDDLFYPNRGKRQMTAVANDNADIDERNDGDDDDNNNNYNNNDEDNDIKANENEENQSERLVMKQKQQQQQQHPLLSNELMKLYVENLMAKMKRKLQKPQQNNNDHDDEDDEKLANSFDEMSKRNEPTLKMSTTFQQAPPLLAAAATKVGSVTSATLPSLLKKRFNSMINILHNRKQQQQRHHQKQQHSPNHNNARRQWWKRYIAKKTSPKTRLTNSIDRPMSGIHSPTLATNRLQTTLRSMSPLQQLTQLYQQQQQIDLSPPYMKPAASSTKFMWQQPQKSLKSLAQQFDPLSWHKLQLLLQLQQKYQHQQHQPLLTMRHPRLTALQHLPAIQQPIQQHHQQHMATPQETQLTYSSDQPDNGITNDLDNFYNKDLD